MKDTKEIVLFFKDNTKYNTIDIAKDIVSRYPELGNPIILPENENKRAPLIVFKENNEFQIQTTLFSVTIVVKHSYFDKIATIVFDVVDAFETLKCSFKRIGYVSSIFMSPKYVEKAKNRFLNSEHLSDIEDYNLNFYKSIDTKYGKLNYWERIITDKANFNDLLCQYDINSVDGEDFDFNMKYIKEFFIEADKMIEDRLNY